MIQLWRRVMGLVLCMALALVFVLSSRPVNTSAAINQQINFQGKLTNANGTNIADGTYNIEFKIWDAATSGSTLWTEDRVYGSGSPDNRVTVTDGNFQVNLGSVTALPGSVDFNSSSLYLSINLGNTSTAATFAAASGDGDMTPRIAFTAAPYAFNADKLDGLDSAAFGQLSANQTWLGTNTLQPTTNITSAIVKQTSFASATADILNVQTANGTNIIQVTGPTANEAAVTINSVGATRALTLDSASGTLVLGSNTTTLQKSGTAFTFDVNSALSSTLTITNAGAGTASLAVEGNITTSGTIGTASTTTFTGAGATFSGTVNANGGISLAANQDITTTSGTGSLTLNSTVTNASDEAITVTPSYTGGATDLLTYSAIGVTGFSPTNASGTDTVNGISIGTLVDPGATITSTAVKLGSGWDTLIGGTSAGTNLLGFTNFTVSTAGTVTLAAGQSYTGSGAVSVSSGGANALNLDTGGGAAINLGSTNATSIVIGGNSAATIVAKAATTSTTAFTLQGASGTKFIILDSQNSRLQIGDTAVDNVGVLLVLDSKSGSGEPSAIDGGMYYNSAYEQFRCARDGNWENCGINPIDRGYVIEDEFMSGAVSATTATPGFGGASWTGYTVGATACAAYSYNNATPATSSDRPGIIRMRTGAAANTGCNLIQSTTTGGSMTIAAGQVIKISSAIGSATANTVLQRVGVTSQTTTAGRTNSGVWWEADPTTNANWQYCFGTGAAATCAASATAIAANTMVRLEIRVTATGAGTSAATFVINGTSSSVSGVTIDSTTLVSPNLQCTNSGTGAVAQSCFIDYFQLRGITSAAR